MIAGVDPSSSKLAVVTDDDGWMAGYTWRSDNPKWVPGNCLEAFDWVISNFLGTTGTVWIEEPLVGRSAHSTIVQAMTSGAAQAAFLHLGWDVRMVNVQTWKKAVIGRGGASKDDIRRSMGLRLPDLGTITNGDPDLIDAAAICAYGRLIAERAEHILDGARGL